MKNLTLDMLNFNIWYVIISLESEVWTMNEIFTVYVAAAYRYDDDG